MSFSLFVQTDKKGYQHKLADSGILKRVEATFFNESLCSVTKKNTVLLFMHIRDNVRLVSMTVSGLTGKSLHIMWPKIIFFH